MSETTSIMSTNKTNVLVADDEKVGLRPCEVIEILKQLEGIKRKLQPLLKQ